MICLAAGGREEGTLREVCQRCCWRRPGACCRARSLQTLHRGTAGTAVKALCVLMAMRIHHHLNYVVFLCFSHPSFIAAHHCWLESCVDTRCMHNCYVTNNNSRFKSIQVSAFRVLIFNGVPQQLTCTHCSTPGSIGRILPHQR